MVHMKIKKVTITGVPLRDLPRLEGLRGKNFSGARVITDVGEVDVRLQNFAGVDLSHCLHPGASTQSHVSGPVLEQAERILLAEPKVLERLEPSAVPELDFDNLPFGLIPTDAMYVATSPWGGRWSAGKLVSFGDLLCSPAAVGRNYGQALFEGAKAQRTSSGRLALFRPEENSARLNRGAERLVLNPVPLDLFLEGVSQVVLANESFVPSFQKGALYLRPVLDGCGARLGVHPAEEDRFSVFASPVGKYFPDGLKLWVERFFHRAGPGGTGAIKAIGNYATGLLAAKLAKAKGFGEVLYLSLANSHVEEVGAANAFFVKYGVGSKPTIYTPRLTDTILPGITRASVITLARDLGYPVSDCLPVSLDFVLRYCDEAFCTGTAAVISHVASITDQDSNYGRPKIYNNGLIGEVTQNLFDKLTGIQQGVLTDPYGWVRYIS